VIDSDSEVRLLVRSLLEEHGYNVRSETDPGRALACVAQIQTDGSGPLPRLFLMEYEALAEKEQEILELLHRMVPVAGILLSSAGDVPAAELLAMTAVQGVVYKPFTIDHLPQAVRKALDGEWIGSTEGVDL